MLQVKTLYLSSNTLSLGLASGDECADQVVLSLSHGVIGRHERIGAPLSSQIEIIVRRKSWHIVRKSGWCWSTSLPLMKLLNLLDSVSYRLSLW